MSVRFGWEEDLDEIALTVERSIESAPIVLARGVVANDRLHALADGGRRASASLGLAAHVYQNRLPESSGGTFQFISHWSWHGFEAAHLMVVVLYVVLAYYFLEISGAEKGEPGDGIRGKWSQKLAQYLIALPGA